MRDPQGNELTTIIADWLEQERDVYLRAANRAGIESSVATTEPIAENVTETSLKGDHVPVNISPLAVPVLAWRLPEAIQERDAVGGSPARLLYEHYGDRCRVWSPTASLLFKDAPMEWIYNTILTRVRLEYLAALESLESGRRELADDLARDLLDLFERDTVDFVTTLPVAGIRFAEDPVEIANIRFRSITSKELGRLFEAAMSYPLSGIRRRSLSTPHPEHVSERWALEVRTPCEKLVQPQAGFQPMKLVLALQLLGFELHGSGFATTWIEPGPSLFGGGQKFRLPQWGESKDCSREELERALALTAKIQDGAILRPTSPQELVLHRFLLGAAEESRTDALIDYTISLEGFLLPPSKYGEYRFKFGLFGAWYLGSDRKNRAELSKDLRGIYDLRSEIVHGVGPPLDEKIAEGATRARELAARMIVKALENGWPSHNDLSKAPMG